MRNNEVIPWFLILVMSLVMIFNGTHKIVKVKQTEELIGLVILSAGKIKLVEHGISRLGDNRSKKWI